MLRVGIIGLGYAGRQHLDAWLQNPEAEVKVICDQNEAIARPPAEEHNLKYVKDYTELVRDKEIDAVSICTPDYMHAEQALAAVQSGKHVFCEKPLATNVLDCQRIVEAVDKSKVKFLTGQVLRFAPFFQSLKSIYTSGMLGEAFFAESDYIHDLRPFLSGWRCGAGTAGDLTLSGGCHPVDLLRWIVGEIDEVYANSNKLALKEAPFPADNILLTLKFRNGATGKVQITTGCRRPYALNLSVYGTKGTLMNNKLYTEDIRLLEDFIDLPLPQKAQYQYYDKEIEELVSAIKEDREPSVSALEGARTVAVCQAGIESAARNCPVKVFEF